MLRRRKLQYSLLLFTLVFSIVLFFVIRNENSDELRVVFFDVGQGDAILISNGNSQILIDGGPSRQEILKNLGRYMPFWDRRIETVIATHPDKDHIAGLVDVLKTYQVGLVIESQAENDTDVFRDFEKLIEEKGIRKENAKLGDALKFRGDATVEILYPFDSQNKSSDTNLSSIVARLSLGQESFLFTGDLPSQGEDILITGQKNIESKVLKVSHHGSKNSSTEGFLEKVRPEEAVISVGKGNRYGHPSPETLERLRRMNSQVLRTDELGNIAYSCSISRKICQREGN